MMGGKVYIIAEAGVNHNGNIEIAKELVRKGAEAGVNAVKFQTFKPEHLVTRTVEKAEYQKVTTGNQESQLEMLKKLTLQARDYVELEQLCKECDVDFISTPFDSDSLHFLITELDMPFIKIPSGEITNAPFLLEIAHTHKSVMLSTGMATLGEVEQALEVLAYGYLCEDFPSDFQMIHNAFVSEKGQNILKKKVRLLHCTTQYPAPLYQVNLNAMETMTKAFGVPVGYSDHTEGIIIPIAAVAKGAVVIEKHFTLDKNMEGPDHKASLEPDELKNMVQGIRIVERAIGNGIKIPVPAELPNIHIARKSLVAAKDIEEGEVLSRENLTAKRAGEGISPMDMWFILGRKTSRSYVKDEIIKMIDVCE